MNGRYARTLLILLGIGVSAAVSAPSTQAKEQIPIKADEATLIKLPDRVATIIIGNPIIADATLHAGGFLILTGKTHGQTNFIALDRKGQILMERMIAVVSQPGSVLVHRGINRESYSCTPDCQPTLALGDSMTFFSNTNGQSAGRAARAEGATPTSGTVVTGRGNDTPGAWSGGGPGGGMNINIQLGGR